MSSTTPQRSVARPQPRTLGSNPAKALVPFAVAALCIGVPLLALSTVIKPEGPFMLASTLLGLVLPALYLSHREGGGAAVRALLRDCVRLPDSRWWLPLAAFVIPVATWTAGAASGGGKPLDWDLVSFYIADLLIGAVVINIWEEMAWTGFFQRRAAGRWGAVGGALMTSLFFTALHSPLAFDDVHSASAVATNLVAIAGVATGVRLLIARVDSWTGRSLLTIGLLHSSFNASKSLVRPDYDFLRIAVTIALGVGVIACGRRRHPSA
ncbi:MAG TPA: CPBP family intramembrane glutamic endopeptidase [Propionibacteriaceae bacterium]